MSRIPLLKTLVTLMFAGTLILLFFSIPFVIMLWVMPENIPSGVSIKWLETGKKIDIEATLYFLSLVTAYGFFAYALYLLRKILDLFARRILFDIRTISALDQAGKAIITGCIIDLAATFIYRLATSHIVEIKPSIGINSTIVTICLGLFFMVLSEVFLMAKKLKEENDLTV